MSRRRAGVAATLALAACAWSAACGGTAPDARTTPVPDAEGGAPSPADDAAARYEHYMNQAGLAIAEERPQDALDAYLAAAEVLDGTGEITIERAEAHFLAADVAYQRMEKDLALEEYQKSVDIYLRFTGNSKIKAAVALTNMGVIYKEKAMKDKARNCWEQALQLYKEAPHELQDSANMRKIQQNITDLDNGY